MQGALGVILPELNAMAAHAGETAIWGRDRTGIAADMSISACTQRRQYYVAQQRHRYSRLVRRIVIASGDDQQQAQILQQDQPLPTIPDGAYRLLPAHIPSAHISCDHAQIPVIAIAPAVGN